MIFKHKITMLKDQLSLISDFRIQISEKLTKASALEGRSYRAEGRRLVILFPFKLVGFNAPCKQSLLVFD
jgi:hypothetical protein